MTDKVIDAEENLRKAKTRMNKMKSKIEEQVKDSRKRRNIIDNLNKKRQTTKMKQLKKGEKFMQKKYRDEDLTEGEIELRRRMPNLECVKEDKINEDDDKDEGRGKSNKDKNEESEEILIIETEGSQ